MASLTRVGFLIAPARLLAISLLLSSAVGAQQPVGTIAGTVVDSAGKPIPGVEVIVAARAQSTRSDTTGRFRIGGVRAGKATLTFRHFGYEPRTLPAAVTAGATANVDVVLQPLVQELPGMLVMEQEQRARQMLQDFYRRKESGNGYFITRQDIENRNPLQLSDMLRTMPGAVLEPMSGTGRATLRFARTRIAGRDCPPQYYVDGVIASGLNIDDLEPSDIEGIEVYSGASRIPPQFNNSRIGTSICGVVVVWTRIPGT